MKTYIAKIPVEGKAKGKATKEHEFQSPDEDCAQAMCDAHDWVLLGELTQLIDPSPESWKSSPKKSKASKTSYDPHSKSSNPILKKGQLATLCQLAKSAYDHMENYGLIEGVDESLSETKKVSQWRRQIVKMVTGKTSMTKCRNSDYRRIEAEFLKLGGKKYENPKAFQTGQQSQQVADTMEAREQAIWLISEALKKHAEKMENAGETDLITEAYIHTIAQAQNKETKLADFDALLVLPAGVLKKLLYTAKNRIRQRERKYRLAN